MPQEPPPGIPVVSYPTPQIVDRVLIEEVTTEAGDYKALQPGQPHNNPRDYPGFVFVMQRPSRWEKWVQRIYVNERSAQNTYNADYDFAAESNAHPVYTRSYLVRRDGYSPATKGSALTGVVGARVTAGGSGYPDSGTTVTPSGGGGSGATFLAVVYRGVLYGVIVTAEGTGYTSAPTLTVAGSGGSGATAVSLLQPASAVLRKESAKRLEGDPVDSLFIRVTRLYQTLPGPVLTSEFITPRGEFATRQSQEVAAGTDPTAETFLQIESKVESVDSVVSVKETTVINAHFEGVSWAIFKKIDGTLYLEKTTRTKVDPDTKPTGGANVILDDVEAISYEKSERTIIEVTDADGVDVGSIPSYWVWKCYPRERVMAKVYFQFVEPGSNPPALSAQIGTGLVRNVGSGTWTSANAFVINIEERPQEKSDKVLRIVEACPIPPDREEYHRIGVVFPAIFNFLQNYIPDDGLSPPAPRLGIHYSLTPHRSEDIMARVTYHYSLGQPPSFPQTKWRVVSPAGGSKAFPMIPENCIHPAYDLYSAPTATQGAVLLERVAASTPPNYSSSEVLLYTFECPIWKGLIHEGQYWQVSETTDPRSFPVLNVP